MRHRKSFNHLGRTSSHRNAMLANMAASLILHKRISTTTAKAKALRSFVEPLITKSKEDTTHSRRTVFNYLQNKEAVAELFREVAVKVHDRPGGYTRLLKLGARLGDSAEMCIIELVDFNENLLGEPAAKVKTGRRRRGGKKKEQEKSAVAPVPEKDEKIAGSAEEIGQENEIADEAVQNKVEDNMKTKEDTEPGKTKDVEVNAKEEGEAETSEGTDENPLNEELTDK